MPKNAPDAAEGTLIFPEVSGQGPPERISADDMELLLAFQQDMTIAQRAYNTLMNQFAQRYQLRDGDRIEMDSSIVRRNDGPRT